MSTLKILRNRIQSVKSTQKITSAMKLVASSYFKKSERLLLSAEPHTKMVAQALGAVLRLQESKEVTTPLLLGGKGSTHLLILIAGDRGLCGGFNMNIGRHANKRIRELLDQGKTVKILGIGTKCLGGIHRDFLPLVEELIDFKEINGVEKVGMLCSRLVSRIQTREIDECSLLYTSFHSIISSVVETHSLIPFTKDIVLNSRKFKPLSEEKNSPLLFDVEPDMKEVLEALAFENIKAQLYFSLKESQASEHSARMMAMDNATKNAKEMLEKLETTYHRTRQYGITKELIEIVAGAEAI